MVFGKFQLILLQVTVVAGLAVAISLVAWRAQTDATLALVIGLTFAVTIGAAYVMYRLEERSASSVRAVSRSFQETRRPAPAPTVVAADVAVAFRVVRVRGACLKGRRVGDVVRVERGGQVSPALCSFGEATLRLAAADSGEPGAKAWCCPVYDHMLVFERQLQAA